MDTTRVLPLPAFYLCGPTASGKSAVALALAQRIGGEIVNADAFQLYRGLDLCTAKPSLAERAQVPHHLFDVLHPLDVCDAQRYRDLAEPVIRAVVSRQRWPIVVGGSGLYVKALTHGLANLPKSDAALRAELAQLSREERVAELLRLDPEAASNVSLGNDRYVSRALEICRLTGQAQSTLRQHWLHHQPTFTGALLTRDREDLYHRINARVLQMMEAGVVDEVRSFLAAQGRPPLAVTFPQEQPHAKSDAAGCGPEGISTDLPDSAGLRPPALLSAIGVREITAYLRHEASLEWATDAMQQSTRRYAKRQITWFRREPGFRTICLARETNPDFVSQRLTETFPCLCRPPLFDPSL